MRYYVNTSDATHTQRGWVFTMVVQHSSSLSTLAGKNEQLFPNPEKFDPERWARDKPNHLLFYLLVLEYETVMVSCQLHYVLLCLLFACLMYICYQYII